MSRLFTWILAFCVPLVMVAHAGEPDRKPSDCAAGMPGAKATIEFKPDDWMPGETTWWKDTDGIAPGTAGCHIGTDNRGAPNGRMFGEACLENGLLVESNPGAYAVHSHKSDIGHPDTFDCNEWCIGTGAAKGACTEAAAPPCATSAVCACD